MRPQKWQPPLQHPVSSQPFTLWLYHQGALKLTSLGVGMLWNKARHRCHSEDFPHALAALGALRWEEKMRMLILGWAPLKKDLCMHVCMYGDVMWLDLMWFDLMWCSVVYAYICVYVCVCMCACACVQISWGQKQSTHKLPWATKGSCLDLRCFLGWFGNQSLSFHWDKNPTFGVCDQRLLRFSSLRFRLTNPNVSRVFRQTDSDIHQNSLLWKRGIVPGIHRIG